MNWLVIYELLVCILLSLGFTIIGYYNEKANENSGYIEQSSMKNFGIISVVISLILMFSLVLFINIKIEIVIEYIGWKLVAIFLLLHGIVYGSIAVGRGIRHIENNLIAENLIPTGVFFILTIVANLLFWYLMPK